MKDIVDDVSSALDRDADSVDCAALFCWVYWTTDQAPLSQVSVLQGLLQEHMPEGPGGEATPFAVPAMHSGVQIGALLARRPLTYEEMLASIDLVSDMSRATWQDETAIERE
ncbi:MAG: hypothetical protein AAF602_15145 [Myxococcota bacterium]